MPRIGQPGLSRDPNEGSKRTRRGWPSSSRVRNGIPPSGALSLLWNDPPATPTVRRPGPARRLSQLQWTRRPGRRVRRCANGCRSVEFASHKWLTGLLTQGGWRRRSISVARRSARGPHAADRTEVPYCRVGRRIKRQPQACGYFVGPATVGCPASSLRRVHRYGGLPPVQRLLPNPTRRSA